jgi:hypothetical protein
LSFILNTKTCLFSTCEVPYGGAINHPWSPGTWISEIYLCCNEFYPTFKEEERAEIPFAKTEEQLRDAVKNLLPEIKKYF